MHTDRTHAHYSRTHLVILQQAQHLLLKRGAFFGQIEVPQLLLSRRIALVSLKVADLPFLPPSGLSVLLLSLPFFLCFCLAPLTRCISVSPPPPPPAAPVADETSLSLSLSSPELNDPLWLEEDDLLEPSAPSGRSCFLRRRRFFRCADFL